MVIASALIERADEPAADRLIREAWRGVATARLTEYRRQAWRLGMLVKEGGLNKDRAVEELWGIALANGLVSSCGEDRIQGLLAEAFADDAFCPIRAEVA